MGSLFTIRAATRADVPAILDIYNEAVLTTTASYDESAVTLESRQLWFDEHMEQKLPVLVATCSDSGVIGWASLSPFRQKSGYRFTVENSVYVHSLHRGRGVASALLQPLIDDARRLGFHSVMAGIDGANQVSLRLHARFGFVQVAYLPQVGFKFGRWLDVVYLQLMLG